MMFLNVATCQILAAVSIVRKGLQCWPESHFVSSCVYVLCIICSTFPSVLWHSWSATGRASGL